ncbi:MAG: pentapeptide repeat-containing protein [Sulfurimonas sp.]|uniref:pentapeptide repeat-containing protein n=1 Tax=Sulfurimonas sp. TaxID=2022749 RepID=UPI003D11ACFF
MSTCSVCNKDFEDEYFDVEQKRCILHCEKDDWFTLDENDKKIWDDDKVKLFWKYIQNDLDKKYNTHITDSDLIEKEYILSNVIFPKFQDEVEYCSPANNEDKMGTNFYSYRVFEHPYKQSMPEVNTFFTKLIVLFNSCTFLDDANFKKYNFEHPILFNNCTFESEIELNKIYTNRVSFLTCSIQNLNCQDIIFEQKVKIQNCIVNGKVNFYNTKFKELADFYNTNFYDVNFKKTTFEDISVFTESEFYEDVDFKYTTFKKSALFRKTKFEKTVNFEDSIFKEEANFLDITANMANRETARIIKNSFEQQNNIIEANKFYTLEMKEREKELTKDIKNGKNIVDWLIFKAHAISSNHSQDWLLALFWIIVIGALYTIISFCSTNTCLNNINTPILIGSIFLVSLYSLHVYNKNDYKQFTKYIFLFLLFVNYFTLTKDVTLSCLADKINPTSEEPITFGLLMFKITIAYLIYQFIVSVRQNTRRK